MADGDLNRDEFIWGDTDFVVLRTRPLAVLSILAAGGRSGGLRSLDCGRCVENERALAHSAPRSPAQKVEPLPAPNNTTTMDIFSTSFPDLQDIRVADLNSSRPLRIPDATRTAP